MIISASVSAQVISGHVEDQNHDALPFITVTIKGTSIRTLTNDKGEFHITAVSGTPTLIFSAVNIQTHEVAWTGQKDLQVILRSAVSSLDEIQVVAYGTNTQRHNVGSVTKVSAEDIAKQPVSNPLSVLQGRVPGLTVVSSGGIPGASVNLQIRGKNTLRTGPAVLTARDNPLYLIDGVPFAPQNSNVNQFPSVVSPGIGDTYNNAYGGVSPFNSINPADIESIEVLRDADATAIYGSRGGNGVFLITTKKGKAGQTKFDLSLNQGFSKVGKTMSMMNTAQYLEMRNEAFKNDGLVPNLTLFDEAYAPDLLLFDQARSTDWKQRFIGSTAHRTNAVGSLSGGNANSTFRIGFGFNRESYVFPGDFSDRRANLSLALHHATGDKKLSLDLSAGYSYDTNNASSAQTLLQSIGLDPNYPDLLNKNGDLVWDYKGATLYSMSAGSNPLAYLRSPYQITNRLLNSSLLMRYHIVGGLNFTTNFGYNRMDGDEYSATPFKAQNPAFGPVSSARFGKSSNSTWLIEPRLEYSNVTAKSNYGILIGGTLQHQQNALLDAFGSGYLNDQLLGSITPATSKSISDNFGQYKYAALFGRINYRYDDKYLVSLNARRDGSSRFGSNHQFGNFWSVGAGWLFNEERFIKDNLSFFSYGKLRGSYGTTGSDANSDYQYLSRWASTTNQYQGQTGYVPLNLANAELGWATTKKLEVGIELGFVENRILLNTTWYRNRSGNQLVTYPLPTQTGFSSIASNWDAVVQNSGFEFVLQTINFKKKDLGWSSAVNVTIPKNKLLSFPGIERSTYYNYFIGRSLSTITGFRYAGVNSQTGLYEFYTAGGEKTSAPEYSSGRTLNDYTLIGDTDPKFFGGFSNTIFYKNFQIDIFFEFKKQNGYSFLKQVLAGAPAGFEQNLPVEILNGRWTKPGDNAKYQRFTTQYGEAYSTQSYFNESDASFGDASYIRCKNVSVSYGLPAQFTDRLKAKALRVYLNAQNLFTITKYKGNDPETQSFYGIPPLKTINLGAQFTF